MKKKLLPFLLLVQMAYGQKQPKEPFISQLIQRMTLDEKIGQLNLLTGGEATTGSVVSTAKDF
ncbi:hypothetical protein [Arsenicibacter rosenii]|uniref:Beta-glucosidase n=1 Tax=Arsenicibacter rosenii TaxID=1750698 RepID=A0A1S2VPK8_9BACT|nr:hypothetical protein [Arsenicibacter rosenii]OIN60701.1 hypothetical protein BLX24_00885 [Arsenicibacter rosenii]